MKKAASVSTPFVPPSRVLDLRLPDRVPGGARQADRDLLAQAPKAYLDTTHFDTVRFPPPEWAASAINRASRDGSLAYTGYRGHPAVLESVAARLGDVFGLQFDPSEELMLTPGTQAGLFGALASLIGQDDDVLLVDPDYLFSERILRFLGARVTHIPLTAGASPHPDLNRLEDAFKRVRPKLFVFSHPNNPTGSVYSPDIIAVIAELAVRYDAMVLVDELYARLVYEGTPYVHLATLPGMMDRTITLVGPSKTESLSGYRLGVVGAPAAVIKGIEDIQSITSLRAPAYAQHVLMPWLRDDHEWLVNRLMEFHKLRAMTVHAFEKLPWLTLHIQNATCYAWPDVSALMQSDTAISRALMCEGAMLVSPGYQFGPSGAGHFRLCYARDEVEWAQALERIVCVLDRFALAAGLPGRTA